MPRGSFCVRTVCSQVFGLFTLLFVSVRAALEGEHDTFPGDGPGSRQDARPRAASSPHHTEAARAESETLGRVGGIVKERTRLWAGSGLRLIVQASREAAAWW